MEHLQHFGLSQDPFQNEPDLRFYFESAAHADGQRRVERGLRQGKGLTVLIGEPGTGKTLLARRVFEGLEEELFEALFLVAVKGSAGHGSFLARMARQLGIDEPGEDAGALMSQIADALAVIREDGRHAILIVDEAGALSSDAFSELSALLNLEYEERRLLSVLLVGSPELDLALHRDAGLMQRVDVRVVLRELDLQDSGRYLSHRIRTTGGAMAILPDESVQALYKFSRGRPRLLNTLADNGLFEAFLEGRAAVAAADVERAAGDLGIGADPGTTFTQLSASSGSALASRQASPVTGELSDPNAGPAILPSGPDVLDLDAEAASEVGQDASLGLSVGPDDSFVGQAVEDELPSFHGSARPAPSADAEKTRVAFPEELDAEEGDGEVDDLFAELLDD